MATDYQGAARSYAQAANIDPNIFVQQIQAESSFNPRAVSPAGAQGIAQFMPQTAAGMGVNPWDPMAALKAAAYLDSANLQRYGGDYKKMLAAYNAGGGTVDNAVKKCGNGWLGCMPGETQSYVQKILNLSSTSKPNANSGPGGNPPANPPPPGSNMLADIKRWGEYVAIFVLALVLIIIGFILLAEKQAQEAARTIIKAVKP